MAKLLSFMPNLQTNYHFELDFQKLGQHTGGKWLIHGTKHREEVSSKAWNSLVEYPSRESTHVTKESKDNMFNQISKGNVQGRKHPGRCACAESEGTILPLS